MTVVFCDITGSTALGESADPSRCARVLARYFERMKAIVERHGGTVEKFIGDAVMAVFGVPVLHEDDALRALRAAREMRDALAVARRAGAHRRQHRRGRRGHRRAARHRRRGERRGAARAGGAARRGATSARRRCSSRATRRGRAGRAARAEGQVAAGRRVSPRLGPRPDEPRAPSSTRPSSGASASSASCARPSTSPRRDRACQLFTLLGVAGVGKSRLVAEFLARRRRDRRARPLPLLRRGHHVLAARRGA